jgi:hypothetical protein
LVVEPALTGQEGMEVDESTIYWLTRCDHVRELLVVLTFLSGFISAGILLATMVARFADDGKATRHTNLGFALFWILSASCLAMAVARPFVPTTREMVAIKVLPMVAANEDLQKLGGDIPLLLREWVEELRPKKLMPGKPTVPAAATVPVSAELHPNCATAEE